MGSAFRARWIARQDFPMFAAGTLATTTFRAERPQWVESGRSAVAQLECLHRVESRHSLERPQGS